MKYTGKIQDYIDQFGLALTLVTLILENSLSIFLVGLDHHTQMHVRMFNPYTFAHVANLAKLHEVSQPSSQKPNSGFSFSPKYQGLLHKPTNSLSSPALVPLNSNTTTAPLVIPNTIPKPTLNRPTRTYCTTEMVEFILKGCACFVMNNFAQVISSNTKNLNLWFWKLMKMIHPRNPPQLSHASLLPNPFRI